MTHSSGNHAQALASAAKQLGIPAYVVMPSNSPDVKKDAVKGYGAVITECEPTLQARESTCEKIIEETGATFIHPYDNVHVIAGQGTLMLEFIEQTVEMGAILDAVLIPVGGGGMLSGCAIAANATVPKMKIFGAEPEFAKDAQLSLLKGQLMKPLPPTTCADGLLTALSQNTFDIILRKVDAIYTVTEEEIIRAMKLVWERMKQVIEPSAAVGLAVALFNQDFRACGGISNIGIVLCGGNVQFDRAMQLFATLNQKRKSVVLLKTKSVPNDPYEKEFMDRGYMPHFVPVLEHAVVNEQQLLESCRRISQKYSGLIVTSQRSVESLGRIIGQLPGKPLSNICQLTYTSDQDAVDLRSMPIYTVGPATHRAIENIGFSQILGSKSGNGDALSTFIIDSRRPEETLPYFFIVGDKRRDIIHKRLSLAHIPLEELVVYQTIESSDFPRDFTRAVERAGAVEWIVFFSPAGASVALSYIQETENKTTIATIGPTTRDYLVNEWAMTPTVVAPVPEASSLVGAILRSSSGSIWT